MRYTLLETGPDNSSTYAECFGSTRTSDGKHIAASACLVGLMLAVDTLGHDNFWIRGPGRRCVAANRKDYYALPPVASELRRIVRSEQQPLS